MTTFCKCIDIDLSQIILQIYFMMYAEGNFLGSSSSSDNESGYDDSPDDDDDVGATVITVNGKILTAGKVKQALRLYNFSCSTQLRMKFIMLIYVKMPTMKCWHFNIYKHDKYNI